MEEIVEVSLLNEKVAVYCQDPKADKMCILNKISFCEARQKVLLLTSSTFVYMSCCVISDYIGCYKVVVVVVVIIHKLQKNLWGGYFGVPCRKKNLDSFCQHELNNRNKI